MKRKIGWFFLILLNLVRLKIHYLFSLGKVRCSWCEIISYRAKLKVACNGVIKVGYKCTIEEGTLIRATEGKVQLGYNVYINRNCNIISRKKILIGNKVTIGPNVCVYDHDHNIYDKSLDYLVSDVIINDNVWIGANVVILKGVTIGEGSIIGAGTVVTKNVPSNTIIMNQYDVKQKKINKNN